MTDLEKNRLDNALRDFANRNFMKPHECRNLDQVRYYTYELYLKLEEYHEHFRFVPGWALVLLSQYKQVQTNLANRNFRAQYA